MSVTVAGPVEVFAVAAVVAVVDPVELVAVAAVVAVVDPVAAEGTCSPSRQRYDTHGQEFDEFRSHCWRLYRYKARSYCSW